MIIKFKLVPRTRQKYGNLVAITFESRREPYFWIEPKTPGGLHKFPLFAKELIPPAPGSDIKDLVSFNLLMTIGKLKHHIKRDRIER